MFGFMRGGCTDTAYRQIYAECCSAQRREFGLGSLFFHSYEAIFLYVLATDAGLCTRPPATAVTCCRLRNRKDNWPDFDREAARFCASFALLLAATKLDDDVRDSGSLLARGVHRMLRGRFVTSRSFFIDLDPQFEKRIDGCIDQHLRLEHSRRTRIRLEEYVEPTADAFAYVYRLFGRFLSCEDSHASAFEQIGRGIGAALVSHDCAVDFEKDVRLGRFNPLESSCDKSHALDFSLRCLSQAGWDCRSEFGADSIASEVVSSVFRRVSRQMFLDVSGTSRNKSSSSRKIASYRILRRGFCDCDCDCDCGGCDDCDGGERCLHSTDCCMLGLGELCCILGQSKESGHSEQKLQEETKSCDSELVGSTGHAVGPLNPTGVVAIDDKRIPAKSQGEWIEGGTAVEVIAEERFGVVVRPRQRD